jgi:phosphoribosyl 1,2-cyclic phosphodiesterase
MPPGHAAESPPPTPALCVLASGSSGNCSVLIYRLGDTTRAALIDLGLSPRRTFKLLADLGLGPHHIDHAILTHFDHDHFHPSWPAQLPHHTRLRLHHAHLTEALARGLDPHQLRPFDEPVSLEPHLTLHPILLSHDDEGVAAFRLDFSLPAGFASLGFATDLGHATDELLDHFAHVDTLAIESNYCPKLQLASDRPDFLKHRIMGGRGHLSNQQSARVVHAIAELGLLQHAVLLHLSRQCNDPALALAEHAGADYAVTVALHDQPTRWITLSPRPGPTVHTHARTERSTKRTPSPVLAHTPTLFPDA